MAASPAARPGDTTAWYASFWEFFARYSSSRFGDAWHPPETSLLIHAEATHVPRQVVIRTPEGTNHTIDLPFGTSLFDYLVGSLPESAHLTDRNGLRLLTPAAALERARPSFFQQRPVEAQVVLAGIRDPSDLLAQVLEGDRTVVAGRLVGGLRRIGRQAVADEIAETMAQAGHRVRKSDPFETDRSVPQIQPCTPAIVARMQGMWDATRPDVVEAFPDPPRVQAPEVYLERVEAMYERDAYHSLSIEGYRVTPQLIERVRTGAWDPDENIEDREGRDALAARGYWQAFQRAKEAIAEVLADRTSAAARGRRAGRWRSSARERGDPGLLPSTKRRTTDGPSAPREMLAIATVNWRPRGFRKGVIPHTSTFSIGSCCESESTSSTSFWSRGSDACVCSGAWASDRHAPAPTARSGKAALPIRRRARRHLRWPDAVGLAIAAVESADFLSEEQERDILYNNAARFLKLSEEQIAQHHGR